MFSEFNNILIVSIRRSGGKLVRTLLDGHPAIHALLFEHWHTAKKGRFPGPTLERFSSLSPRDKLDVVGFPHGTVINIKRAFGGGAAREFMKDMEREAARAASAPDLYELFARYYFRTFHGIELRGRLANHCGNLAMMTVEELDQVFGPSTKIVIWRDPRAVYVSSEELRASLNKPPTGAELDEFCSGYEQAYRNHGNATVTLQFEELVRDTKAQMRLLASAIGLDASDSLFIPTELGKPCLANSPLERSFGAVDQRAAIDWETRINPKDRATIEKRLGYVLNGLAART